jgi:signal transduction histidine kinase
MSKAENNLHWRDWMIFGLRWLAILGLSALIAFTQNPPAVSSGLITAIIIASAANIVLLLVLLIQYPPIHLPIIAITDLVIAGAFLWAVSPNISLMSIIAGVIFLLTLARPNSIYTAIVTAAVLALGVSTLISAGVVNGNILSIWNAETQLPLSQLVLWSVLATVAALVLERQISHQTRALASVEQARSEQIEDIRERTRAIYEMATTLSATQNYNKLLNAALDAGQLGVRGRLGANLAGAVLLFQTDEPGLRVVAGRRLIRTDNEQILPGKGGIIGKALQDGSPTFGGMAKKDPELQYLVGFQNTRSTLCIPLRAGFDNFGVLVFGSDTVNAFTEEHTELLSAIGVQATISLQNYVLYHNIYEEKDRIVRVAEEERKQLARALHDGPTQKVSAIVMMTTIATKQLEKAPHLVRDELKKMEETARETTKEMRHMLFTLRPLVLESQGLEAALHQLAEKMEETHGQRVEIYVQDGIMRQLDKQRQGVVFYLIEEGVNNARKHAQAKLINADVKRSGESLVIEIVDNGVGFDVKKMLSTVDQRASLGMVNMQERAAMLAGNLHIESTPGKGTRITIVAPINIQKATQEFNGTIAGVPVEDFKIAQSVEQSMKR